MKKEKQSAPNLTARIPFELKRRLAMEAARTGQKQTEIVVKSLNKYLKS